MYWPNVIFSILQVVESRQTRSMSRKCAEYLLLNCQRIQVAAALADI